MCVKKMMTAFKFVCLRQSGVRNLTQVLLQELAGVSARGCSARQPGAQLPGKSAVAWHAPVHVIVVRCLVASK